MPNQNFHQWRIGTINIRTGSDDQKLENVIHEIAKARLSVCCLQEVRRLNNDSVIITEKHNNTEQKFEVYWSGHSSKRHHGVGIAIKLDPCIEIQEINYTSKCKNYCG